MTTQTYSSVVVHTTDTNFRAWGSELSTNLQAAGLAQTLDTGQINWTTVTIPAANQPGGYEIRTLPDASIYYKIEYGTFFDGSPIPMIWITMGEGSNGAGTLTGSVSNRSDIMSRLSNVSTPTISFPTYICVTNDFFGLVFKAGGNDQNGYHVGAFQSGKTVDGNGVGTSTGMYGLFYAKTGNGGAVGVYNLQCIRRAATARVVVNNLTYYCLAIGRLTTSALDNGNQQAYACWGAFPDILPLAHVCAVTRAEVASGTTFQVAMVGTTPHTYLCIQNPAASKDTYELFDGFNNAPAQFSPAMLWE